MPRLRARAVAMVYKGWSIRKVARHLNYHHTAVMRWIRKARGTSPFKIPTVSSRPHHHPRSLPKSTVEAIITQRVARRRCAEVVHQELLRKGISVSVSSVKRTLKRSGLLRERSPWKRPHDFTPRPEVTHAGALLQVDTIHIIGPDGARIYIYTLIDLYSRWAYAEVAERIGVQPSVAFIRRAQKVASFRFALIQTDHGSEFSIGFTHGVQRMSMAHRHSRVRRSNDNAHVERFNRTIQEECLDRVPHVIAKYRAAIIRYLRYYNTERLHMGIKYKTPLEVVLSY
jgi:transposase InsO family protein